MVRLGANRAIFILGKYYAKLDDCEIYPIALSKRILVTWFHVFLISFHVQHWILDPRKTAKWIIKNKGWQPEWKTEALDKVQRRWNESYKPTAQVTTPSPASARPSESQSTNVRTTCLSILGIVVLIGSPMTTIALPQQPSYKHCGRRLFWWRGRRRIRTFPSCPKACLTDRLS